MIREAGKDIETEKALFLAKKFDKTGKRTVEILTKADIVVNIDNLRDIIKEMNSDLTSASKMHLVCCRNSGNGENNHEEEMKVFNDRKWHSGNESLN